MTDSAQAVTSDVELDVAVSLVLERCGGGIQTVLLDGPSGAGKSTLADAIVEAWPVGVTLVRMDDIYPGWGGLAEGGELVHDHLLVPRREGQEARWRRHDWTGDAPAEWHTVPGTRSVLIEGCGVITRTNAPLATVRVWLDAEDRLRKERALARDNGGFDAHWDDWQSQFERFVEANDPATAADLMIRLQ